ncbi:17111_t:CDS:2 [Funneliformis geosporum]|nr:17111_t:CDS:2 [Funneliformis geosporum]
MEYNEKNAMNKQNETVCFSAATEYPRSKLEGVLYFLRVEAYLPY